MTADTGSGNINRGRSKYTLINKSEISLEYTVLEKGPSGIKNIDLWMTTNRTDWQKVEAVKQMAAGLEKLFSMSRADRQAMGARGYQLAAKQFAWSQIASDVRATCNWVLGGGDKPSCVLTE